jgi:type II secretory pathway pseudopilin PulG
MKQKINKKTDGFSLLEVIIAIFVITIGIIGVANLISYSISSVAVAKSQIIATELAQEGLEIVRNIRDSNWLADITWNSGLDTCAGGCRVQYNSVGLLALGGNPVLNINSNGFYLYDVTKPETLFRRKITITDNPDGDINTPDIKVVSEITWSQRGRSFNVNAEDRLYNWK